MQELSEEQNAVIGALAGAIEVTVNQPTVTWKNAVQQGKPITLNPAVAYRGYLSNVLNMGTATMVQFAVSGTMKNVFTNNGQTPLAPSQEILSALIAGTVSGVFCNPLELTMITQQNNGGGFFSTMGSLIKRSPASLFRGTSMTWWVPAAHSPLLFCSFPARSEMSSSSFFMCGVPSTRLSTSQPDSTMTRSILSPHPKSYRPPAQ